MLCDEARVVKWQTRTFEGRMPQGMGVQVPPRALFISDLSKYRMHRYLGSYRSFLQVTSSGHRALRHSATREFSPALARGTGHLTPHAQSLRFYLIR